MIDLTDKHILIIGGSRGIGAATAQMAAQAGANVSINYLNRSEAAAAVVANIEGRGKRAQAFQGDITQDGMAEQVVADSIATLGEIDGLVISAGIFEGATIDEMTPEFWDRTININLRSTYLSLRAAVPSLRRAGGGSIVIYTSTAGQRGSDVFSAYATSKGAQIMFMRSMAQELAPDKIRSNCVAPGWTETEMATDMINEFGREDIVASIPLGRIGRPEDPAAAAIFLLSDLAQFITGSTITVDGGFDMRG
ncbi:MAG: SDR family NAD(P)-dependent oxidoreductase [Chloroflexota bacterium]